MDNGKLDKIISAASKGKGVHVGTLGNPGSLCMVSDWVSSGCLPIDLIMGGGFPVGRVTEVYGEEASGKTLLATQAAIEAQQRGLLVLYADTEAAVSMPYMEQLGVDVDQLVYFNPDTVSEVFDTLEKVADGKDKQMGEDTPMLFVWDSVASTSTMQEIETQDLDQRMYATAAPQISRALRVHARRISKSHVCCVFTNQAKKKLGVMFGDDETTYGGKAISYHSTVRLRLSVGKRIKSDNRSVGMWVHVETRKNKLAPPMQSVSVPMYYGEGIYEDEALVAFGVKLGIIESFKNGWYALHLPKQSIKFTKRTWPDVLDEQWGEIEAHFRMVHNGR